MDDAGPSSSSRDIITFNGADICIDDLFGKGALSKTSAEDQFEELEATAELYDNEDYFDTYLGDDYPENWMAAMKEQKETLADILEKRPPMMKVLQADTNFQKVTDDGRVKKKIVHVGTGKKVEPDSRVYIHYTAFHNDCLEFFDSTLSRKRVSTINLEPPGETITGLRLALKTMHVNEVAQILIHYSYGFLSTGCAPRVPGKATLVYNVKMMGFMAADKLTIAQLSYEERAKLPFSQIFDAAKKYRRDGNGSFTAQDWRKAIRCYRRATDILDEYSTSNFEDNEMRCDLLSTLYANIGQSYLKVNSPEPCCVACKRGLELQYTPTMGHLLRTFAQAKLMLHSYQPALHLVSRARKFGDETKCNLLEKEIREKMAQEKRNEVLMAKAMLGLSTKETSSTGVRAGSGGHKSK